MNTELMKELNTYIKYADRNLASMNFTEHNLAHLTRVNSMSQMLLKELGYDEHMMELAELASYMHDIGNVVNRHDHAHTSAILAHDILLRHGYALSDVLEVMSAIGNHDESTGTPVSVLSAVLLLADKSDVRRSRCTEIDVAKHNIHHRVNYAVYASTLHVNKEKKIITLRLSLDTDYSSVVEYLEIFTGRMKLCKDAAKYLGYTFSLRINDIELIN